MNYTRHEMAALIERYALAVSMVNSSTRQALIVRLMDIDAALARLSPPEFEALTLVGLKQLTAQEAALAVGVDESTIRRRRDRGLDDLVRYVNDPLGAPAAMRTPGWWEWVTGDDQAPVTRRRSVGRPSTTPAELEEKIVVLGCSGASEREISATLDDVPRSTVRSVLKRYGVPRRRGRRPTAPSAYPPGVYCVPDDLIRAYRATLPTD
jgi:hypothetical protein